MNVPFGGTGVSLSLGESATLPNSNPCTMLMSTQKTRLKEESSICKAVILLTTRSENKALGSQMRKLEHEDNYFRIFLEIC